MVGIDNNEMYNRGYLQAIFEGGYVALNKNKAQNSDRVTYDPVVGVNFNNSKVHLYQRSSELLKGYGISHSLKTYNLEFRIVVTGMNSISKLFDLFNPNLFELERFNLLKEYVELRKSKLETNGKARYGEEEEKLFDKLRSFKTVRIELNDLS